MKRSVDILRLPQGSSGLCSSEPKNDGVVLIAATNKSERLAELQRLAEKTPVTGIAPLCEEIKDNSADDAARKAENVLTQILLQGLSSRPIIVSSDVMNNSLGKPKDADEARNNLANLFQDYRSKASMAVIDKRRTSKERPPLIFVFNQEISFGLKPELLAKLVKDDSYFDLYRMLSMDITRRFPEQYAGGFCAEALLAMKVITSINGVSIKSQSDQEKDKILSETIYTLVSGFNAHVLLALVGNSEFAKGVQFPYEMVQRSVNQVLSEARFSTSYPTHKSAQVR